MSQDREELDRRRDAAMDRAISRFDEVQGYARNIGARFPAAEEFVAGFPAQLRDRFRVRPAVRPGRHRPGARGLTSATVRRAREKEAEGAMANLTTQESLMIGGLVELAIARHRRLLARHARATRRGRHPGPVPSLDDVLAGVERHARVDRGQDCTTLEVVMRELRDRLRRRLAEADRALPAGADVAVWVQ